MDKIDDLIVMVNDINRRFGTKVIGSGTDYSPPERIPTSSLSLDKALGGGWPMGRMVLLWGNKSSGKSTMCLRAIAEAQKLGKRCLYIDAEKAYDPSWAEKNGVDIDSLLVMRKNSVDDILSATKKLFGLVDVMVLDSLNTVNSPRFFEEENNSIGQNARSAGELLAKWNAWNEDTLILLISQARNKFSGTTVYVDHGGGLAAEHFPSVIVKLFSSRDKTSFLFDTISSGGKVHEVRVGQMIRWEITKSKVSMPFQSGHLPLYADGRRDDTFEIMDLATKAGIIEKTGSWFRVGDVKLQGESAVREFLSSPENASLVSDIRERIMTGEIPQEG